MSAEDLRQWFAVAPRWQRRALLACLQLVIVVRWLVRRLLLGAIAAALLGLVWLAWRYAVTVRG